MKEKKKEKNLPFQNLLKVSTSNLSRVLMSDGIDSLLFKNFKSAGIIAAVVL